VVLKGEVEAAPRAGADQDTSSSVKTNRAGFAQTGVSTVTDSERKIARVHATGVASTGFRREINYVHWSFE